MIDDIVMEGSWDTIVSKLASKKGVDDGGGVPTIKESLKEKPLLGSNGGED